jgi:hypothetical protein
MGAAARELLGIPASPITPLGTLDIPLSVFPTRD